MFSPPRLKATLVVSGPSIDTYSWDSSGLTTRRPSGNAATTTEPSFSTASESSEPRVLAIQRPLLL